MRHNAYGNRRAVARSVRRPVRRLQFVECGFHGLLDYLLLDLRIFLLDVFDGRKIVSPLAVLPWLQCLDQNRLKGW